MVDFAGVVEPTDVWAVTLVHVEAPAGEPYVYGSFPTQAEAEAWALAAEREIVVQDLMAARTASRVRFIVSPMRGSFYGDLPIPGRVQGLSWPKN